MGRALALILACVAGCYQSPSLASCKYRCGGANNASCPNGFECSAGMCVAPGDQCNGDGGVVDMDGGGEPDSLIDMMTVDAPQCLDPAMNYWMSMPALPTGNNLEQIVVFDGNSDNMLDIAVLDQSDGIGFFAGNGDGTFDPRQGATSGSGSKRMITGDFNRDMQRDDIIVLQSAGSTNFLAIMTSNNDGTFTRTELAIAQSAADIGLVGDLDGNGLEDVLVLFTPTGAARIETFLQSGSSPFWTAGTMTTTNALASTMFVGRVNAGNSPDVVVTLSSQIGIHAATNTNPYTLDTLRVTSVSNPVRAVAGPIRPSPAAPSIATVSSSAGVLVHHVSALATTTADGQYDIGSNPKSIILANLIGDPLPEIVTANSGDGGVSILRNEYATMMAFAPPTTLTTGNNPVDVVAGDFDADGRLDLAVANKGAQNVTVFLNKCTP